MVRNLKEVEVAFETPQTLFGFPLPKLSWKGTFVPTDDEQKLAWAIYVELSTRISLAPLGDEDGSLREALSSYHSLFRFTRDRLHEVGPTVGRPTGVGEKTPIAALVLWMLNGVVRPILAKWHPRLARYEETRLVGVGAYSHEYAWGEASELRRDLAVARDQIEPFIRLFENVCDIRPSLIPKRG